VAAAAAHHPLSYLEGEVLSAAIPREGGGPGSSGDRGSHSGYHGLHQEGLGQDKDERDRGGGGGSTSLPVMGEGPLPLQGGVLGVMGSRRSSLQHPRPLPGLPRHLSSLFVGGGPKPGWRNGGCCQGPGKGGRGGDSSGGSGRGSWRIRGACAGEGRLGRKQRGGGSGPRRAGGWSTGLSGGGQGNRAEGQAHTGSREGWRAEC
jgi:hypothetical protein